MSDDLAKVEAYLREEADFNRSWADGRRGDLASTTPEYRARRIELAAERERWADAVKAAREHRSVCLGVRQIVERCPICHGVTKGGHERDGSDHCWGHHDDEGPNLPEHS